MVLIAVIGLFTVEKTNAFLCEMTQAYHEDQAQQRSRFKAEIDRQNQIIKDLNRARSQFNERIERSKRNGKLLKAGEDRLDANTEILIQFKPILAKLISQDQALQQFDTLLKAEVSASQSVTISPELEVLMQSHIDQLQPESKLFVTTLFRWMKDAQRLSDQWQVEQLKIIE